MPSALSIDIKFYYTTTKERKHPANDVRFSNDLLTH